MGVRFYCGVGETKWNQHPTALGPFACIAPVYGGKAGSRRKNSVKVPKGTKIISDSGAFSDPLSMRLGFDGDRERQMSHFQQYGYEEGVSHIASYDVLIDEVWINGNRHKRRWTVKQADWAVRETIKAAKFLVSEVPAGGCQFFGRLS